MLAPLLAICAACAATPPAPPAADPAPGDRPGSSEAGAPTTDPATTPPLVQGPTCPALRRLSECLYDAVSALQSEPEEGELATFVVRARDRDVAACEDVDADADWSRREGSWDHYDDGTAAVHIVYRFDAPGCASEEVTIVLQIGTASR